MSGRIPGDLLILACQVVDAGNDLFGIEKDHTGLHGFKNPGGIIIGFRIAISFLSFPVSE